jgi:tetratricopeptide (TPR) repeat protein
MKMTRVLALLALLCTVGVCDVAHAANDAQPPTTEQRKAAQKMFEAGDALYEAGRFQEASEAFRQSHSLVRSPNSRLMLARSLRELGNTDEACVEYRGTRDDAAQSGGRYPEALQAATAELSALEGLASAPSSGSKAPVTSTPAPVVAKSAPATAKPPAPSAPDTSTHPLRTAAWISAGVGAVGGIGFAVFGLLNRSTYDKLDEDCPSGACASNASDRVDTGKAYQLTANIGAGLAIVGAAAATTLFIISSPRSPDGPKAAVLIAPGSVQLEGRF